MGKDSPDAPPPRQLDVELQQILSQGPALLASEQLLSPQFAGLDLRNLKLALEGSAGGKQTIYENILTDAWRNRETGEISSTKPVAGLDNKDGGGLWDPYQMHETRQREIDTPATPGLYDLLQSGTQRLGGIQREANTAARTATYNDLRSLNPQQARLFDILAADAEAGLKAGDRLTREETYNTVNPLRSNWAARGLGNSAPGQLDEAVNLVTAGRGVAQQRRANAAGVAQLGNQLYTTPSMAFAPDTTGTAQNFLGFGGGYGQQPSILQQLGGYGSDLFNTNFNSQATANINKANANNAAASNAAQIGSSIAIASILACHAAREVYGEFNPQWIRFRTWLFLGPEKFRRWYLQHAPEWAARLRHNPAAKATVRRWMDRKILEVNHAV